MTVSIANPETGEKYFIITEDVIDWDNPDKPWTCIVPASVRYVWKSMSPESRFFVHLVAVAAAKELNNAYQQDSNKGVA